MCKSILHAGHEKLKQRKMAEIVEENNYRIRAAYRRIHEDQVHREWKYNRHVELARSLKQQGNVLDNIKRLTTPIYPQGNASWETAELTNEEMTGKIQVIDTSARRALITLCKMSPEELKKLKDKSKQVLHFTRPFPPLKAKINIL
mmetsp:Transcript_27586/g.39157  ORF Transcript_27586/g.39157 Transcript_27586/m.39157 type:complete len:146 (-) Transcript_27586:13-450(-)